jgi:hypothetical protein
MRAYQKERFENAVCFFAQEHRRRTGRRAFQTYIYKYLALFDFLMLEQDGVPAFDIAYDAMENGPVPNFYFDKANTDKYRFHEHKIPRRRPQYFIEPIAPPELDYFSDDELAAMRSILDEFAVPGARTGHLINATHQRLRAWVKAWSARDTRKRVPMRYQDQFDSSTPDDILERFNMYEVLNGAAGQRVPLG